MRNFLYRLKYKLSNMNGFMDYLWLGITVLNGYQFIMAALAVNVMGMALSGLFLYLCLMPLLKN